MSASFLLTLLLTLHVLLLLVVAIVWRLPGAGRDLLMLCWMALIPVFGPLVGLCLLLMRNEETSPAEGKHRPARAGNASGAVTAPLTELVPLEEALLINAPRQKRTLMHNVMRTDPMAYLDLLYVARENEDSETVHYATSTIMELQRQMQLELERLREAVLETPHEATAHREYVRLLSRYCESGLLSGPPLERQRQSLVEALADALEAERSEELLRLLAEAWLSLEEYDFAKEAAQQMIESWPEHEAPWIAAVRVAVRAHDRAYMQVLLSRMRRQPIEWTAAGRLLLASWMEEEHEPA